MFFWLVFLSLQLVTLVLYNSQSGIECLGILPTYHFQSYLQTPKKMNIVSPVQHSETSKEEARRMCLQVCFNPREEEVKARDRPWYIPTQKLWFVFMWQRAMSLIISTMQFEVTHTWTWLSLKGYMPQNLFF